MNKVSKLLVASFILTQVVFATITLRINVSPADTYSGTLYYYNASKERQGSGVSITTDSSGLATIYFPSGAAYQSYYFGLKLSGQAENFADNKTYLSDADVITLGADGSIKNVYFTAVTGYTLSGQIQDASGTALGAGVTVNLFEPNYVWRYAVKTDSSGNYSFSDIVSGNYFISAGTDGDYFPKWYNGGSGGAYGNYDWTTINVTSASISGLNVRIPLKATVTGTVSAYGGSGLTGKTVQAFIRGSAFNYVNQTTSGTSGTYTLSIPAGVDLMLRTVGGTYQDTYYDQVYTWPNSTTVNATGGASLSYNFVLHNSWTISGNVNVANAKVEVFEYNNWNNYITETVADSGGHYSITGMNNQNVMLRISAGNNYTKVIYPSLLYFSNISVANRLTVAEGNTYNLSNVTLGAAGTIAGTITAAAGSGIVTVSVTTTTGNYFTHVTLNAGSSYSAPSIPVGNWKVRAERNGCITEYYGGVSDAGSATTVNVTSGTTTGGINITLGTGWAISGNVKDIDAANISDASVKVFKYQAGWVYVTSNTTDSNGNYTIRDIYNGDIFLKVEKSGYRGMIWNNHPTGDYTVADHFVVAESGAYTGRDFQIFKSSTINGTVSYTSGGYPNGGTVKAFTAPGGDYLGSATINASGVYALGELIPGNVKILASTANAVSEYYNDIAITTTNAWAKAATINVPQGTTLTGYNFALLKTYIMSGTITSNHTGANLAGITVNVFDTAGTWVGAATTNASG
jgi:hypothetical protein